MSKWDIRSTLYDSDGFCFHLHDVQMETGLYCIYLYLIINSWVVNVHWKAGVKVHQQDKHQQNDVKNF